MTKNDVVHLEYHIWRNGLEVGLDEWKDGIFKKTRLKHKFQTYEFAKEQHNPLVSCWREFLKSVQQRHPEWFVN